MGEKQLVSQMFLFKLFKQANFTIIDYFCWDGLFFRASVPRSFFRLNFLLSIERIFILQPSALNPRWCEYARTYIIQYINLSTWIRLVWNIFNSPFSRCAAFPWIFCTTVSPCFLPFEVILGRQNFALSTSSLHLCFIPTPNSSF